VIESTIVRELQCPFFAELAPNSHQASTLIRFARIGCRRTNYANARRLCRNNR
jgi:hypothetical protein